MRSMLAANQLGSNVLPKSVSPPVELVLEPTCDGARKTVFPDTDLGNVDKRMKWINGDMEKKYLELLNDGNKHFEQLRQMKETGQAAGGVFR
jgi:hypothetical protein